MPVPPEHGVRRREADGPLEPPLDLGVEPTTLPVDALLDVHRPPGEALSASAPDLEALRRVITEQYAQVTSGP